MAAVGSVVSKPRLAVPTVTAVRAERGMFSPHSTTVPSDHELPAAGWKGWPLGWSANGADPP